MTFISRRTAVGLCLLAGLGGVKVAAGHDTRAASKTLEQAVRHLPSFRRAAAVGEVIRGVADADFECSRAIARLRQEHERSPASSRARFGAWIRQRSAGDYLAGRTMLVRGWMLSETEVAICCVARNLVTSAEGGVSR